MNTMLMQLLAQTDDEAYNFGKLVGYVLIGVLVVGGIAIMAKKKK
jgi:hypothetical protein